MVKDALADLGLMPYAVAGLLIFFGLFVSIALWTMTRRRRQVATWSSLPLADGTEPVEPRGHHHDHDDHHDHGHEDHECKNCGGCSCSKSGSPAVVSISGK